MWELFELVFEDMDVLNVLSVTLVIDSSEQPFELLGFPVQFIFPLDLLNSPAAIRPIGFKHKLPNLAGMIVDLLQVKLNPGRVQKLPI